MGLMKDLKHETNILKKENKTLKENCNYWFNVAQSYKNKYYEEVKNNKNNELEILNFFGEHIGKLEDMIIKLKEEN